MTSGLSGRDDTPIDQNNLVYLFFLITSNTLIVFSVHFQKDSWNNLVYIVAKINNDNINNIVYIVIFYQYTAYFLIISKYVGKWVNNKVG